VGPVSNEFILKVLLVVVKGVSDVQSLGGSVIHGEVVSLTILNERVTIFIFSVTVVSQNRFTQTKLMVKFSESSVLSEASAVRKLAESRFSIEVGDSFSTDRSGPNVLMHIDQGVNASCSKLVDEDLNLVKVVIIIDTSGLLDGFPHDSKTNKVHAPFLKVDDVLDV
jgi:hypothetical protein